MYLKNQLKLILLNYVIIIYFTLFTLPESVPRLTSVDTFEDIDTPYLPTIFPYATSATLELVDKVIFSEITNHRPCEFKSNLLFSKKSTLLDLRRNLKKAQSYFYQLRLCDGMDVKKSRRIDGRPAFFPNHLPPAYSSWLLRNKNYTSDRYLPLPFDGLIFIRQIEGTTNLKFTLKSECAGVCPEKLLVNLNHNEGLLFLSDIWDVSYSARSQNNSGSTAFITETDWT